MSEMSAESPDRTALLAFGATVLIGGTNFIAVKFSNTELAPLYGAGVRFAIACLILFSIVAILRLELPRGRALMGAGVYGLLSFGLAYAFLYFALLGLTAGATSVVMAMTPLVTLSLAVVHGQERFTPRGIAGGLLAVAGIAVLSIRSMGGDLSLIHLLAAVVGVFAASEGSVVVKGFPKSHPITTNAVGMAFGAAALGIASLAFREPWLIPQTARTWIVLTYLSIAGSVGLFTLFLFVIKRWTASASVYALTLMPVVAVTLGVLIANEKFSPEIIVGGALVILGVYVGALANRPPPPIGEPASGTVIQDKTPA